MEDAFHGRLDGIVVEIGDITAGRVGRESPSAFGSTSDNQVEVNSGAISCCAPAKSGYAAAPARTVRRFRRLIPTPRSDAGHGLWLYRATSERPDATLRRLTR
jgi:hypothetical protein